MPTKIPLKAQPHSPGEASPGSPSQHSPLPACSPSSRSWKFNHWENSFGPNIKLPGLASAVSCVCISSPQPHGGPQHTFEDHGAFFCVPHSSRHTSVHTVRHLCALPPELCDSIICKAFWVEYLLLIETQELPPDENVKPPQGYLVSFPLLPYTGVPAHGLDEPAVFSIQIPHVSAPCS